MLIKFRKKVVDGMLAVADIAGVLLAGSGAVVVIFLGKLMLAVVFGAISVGFFLRLVGRRKPQSDPLRNMGLRCHIPSAIIAVIEVAVLVEAANFPVRFSQPGFEPWHWILVAMAFVAAYSFNMWLCKILVRRRRVAPQP